MSSWADGLCWGWLAIVIRLLLVRCRRSRGIVHGTTRTCTRHSSFNIQSLILVPRPLLVVRQAVPRVHRPDGRPHVRVQPDDGQRGLPSAADVRRPSPSRPYHPVPSRGKLTTRARRRFLFFALFSVVGKTSAFIGPLVSSAIITASGHNDNYPFVFLFTLCVPFPPLPFLLLVLCLVLSILSSLFRALAPYSPSHRVSPAGAPPWFLPSSRFCGFAFYPHNSLLTPCLSFSCVLRSRTPPVLPGIKRQTKTTRTRLNILIFNSGVLSTGFLYMVDVEKSRQECAEFVSAEARRAAFADAP